MHHAEGPKALQGNQLNQIDLLNQQLQRLPVARAPVAIDPLHQGLHLPMERVVLGDLAAGVGEHLHKTESPLQLRMALQQPLHRP
jgi:hypothetical protein